MVIFILYFCFASDDYTWVTLPRNELMTHHEQLITFKGTFSDNFDLTSGHSDSKKKIRKLRSRRERSRNGAHFGKIGPLVDLKSQDPTLNLVNPNLEMKKSDSDKALNAKAKKRRKFKRSMTMTSFPNEVLSQANAKIESNGLCQSPRIQGE